MERKNAKNFEYGFLCGFSLFLRCEWVLGVKLLVF